MCYSILIFRLKYFLLGKAFFIINYNTVPPKIWNIVFDKYSPLKMLYCKKFQMPQIIQIIKKHQLL